MKKPSLETEIARVVAERAAAIARAERAEADVIAERTERRRAETLWREAERNLACTLGRAERAEEQRDRLRACVQGTCTLSLDCDLCAGRLALADEPPKEES